MGVLDDESKKFQTATVFIEKLDNTYIYYYS